MIAFPPCKTNLTQDEINLTDYLKIVLTGITLTFLLAACSGGSGDAKGGGGISSFTVTPAAGSNGSISPASPKSVAPETVVSFTITPEAGYSVSSVTGCDGSLTGNIYTTGAVNKNCTVSAAFSQSLFTVTPSAGVNGSVVPNTPQQVPYNGTADFTLTPSPGYGIVSAIGCGGSLSGSTYTTGQVTGDCTVSASFVENQYPVTTLVAAGTGSISCLPASPVASGNTVSCTLTPGAGYRLATLLDNGANVTGSVSGAGAYSISNIAAAHELNVIFSFKQYTVTPSAGSNGTISPNTAQTVSHGSQSSFTITPNSGYSIVSAGGCSGTLSGSTFTTAPISGDCTVSASFGASQYPVTTRVTSGAGSISCAPASPVTSGSTVSCTIAPSAGYQLATLLDNGTNVTASVSGAGIYSITNVSAAHDLNAAFSVKKYTVSTSVGANGSIAPSAAQTVSHGAQPSFTITPNAGYYIASASGCEGTLSGSTFTTAPITGACTVSASFAKYITSGILSLSVTKEPVILGFLDLEIILPVGVLPANMSSTSTADVFDATSSVKPPSIASYTASTRTIRIVFSNTSPGIGVGSLASLSMAVSPPSALTSASFATSATILIATDLAISEINNASTLIQVPVSVILQ